MNEKNGVKDFDIWSFYAQYDDWPFPARWRGTREFGPSKFGIFDTFADQTGREAHLSGEIAKALFAKADELLAKPPAIEQPEILAAK